MSFNSELIGEEQLLLLKRYQLDPVYLNKFPFFSYRIVNSKEQGRFYIDRRDQIKDLLASGEVWEKEVVELIRRHVKAGTIAIDIGAHIGTHTVAMSHCAQKNGVVIAFEPQAKLNRELILNLKLNHCENVISVHSAVGNENGSAYLEPVRSRNEGYRGITSKNPAKKVNLLKLDQFQLSSVSFIKIDVESYELEVLRGAYETIMKNRPVIAIEIGGGWSRNIEDIRDLQYHLVAVIDMLKNVLHYEVALISSAGDYLALPK